MTSAINIVTSIENKILRLTEQHKILREKAGEYEKEIQELKKIHEEYKKTILQLEEKINRIKITQAIKTQEGAEEAKDRITKLVREIDHCIGLLNT
jgi:dsDNA-specific endonuclease/ATPase MutS2